MIENYKLRALEPEDFLFLKSCENDKDFWHVSGTIAPWNDYSLKQHILQSGQDVWKEGQIRLVICDKNEQQNALALVDLFEVSAFHRRAQVGIMVQRKFQGKGLGAISLALLCDYAFDILKLKQLRADIQDSNEVSKKIFEKNGFVRSGILKEWNYMGENQYEDVLIYQKMNHSTRSIK